MCFFPLCVESLLKLAHSFGGVSCVLFVLADLHGVPVFSELFQNGGHEL